AGGGGENSGIATCPAGRRATGGGIGTEGPLSFSLIYYGVHLSGPLEASGATADTDDGDAAARWDAAAVNGNASMQTFRTFALCSASSDAVIEATSFNLGSGQKTFASATCPAGRRALGGGLGTTGLAVPQYFLFSSLPLNATGAPGSTADG